MTEAVNTNGKTIERYRHALGWRQCARSGMTQTQADARRDRALRLLGRLRCTGPHQVNEPWRVYCAFIQ
jgi:hypothetical protein